MRVMIRLHATLRKYLPAGAARNAVRLDLPDGATVAEAIERLGVPPAHAKMMVCGDQHLEPATVLRDGQEVNLYPPLAGG